MARGLAVGLVMTMGFIAVFGTFGILFATVINQGDVLEYVPYVIIAIGVILIPLGISMLLGRELVLRLPKMNRGTGSRDLGSVFMFGVSYAVVSLSCTVGIFISGVSNSFSADGIARGTGNFLAYGIGGKAGFTQPMVFALGWGLLFATLLTLLLLPCTLTILDDAKRLMSWMWRKVSRKAD